MTFKEHLLFEIRNRCIERGDFLLKSGERSSFYLDLRKLSISGEVAVIVDTLDAKLREVFKGTEYLHFDAIGGPSVGADPIIGAYLYQACWPRGFLVRPSAKDHGKNGRVIGSVRPGDRCVFVEDVTTSGQSLLEAINAAKAEFNITVALAISVVDREAGAAALFDGAAIPFCSLLTLTEVLEKLPQ